MTRPLLVVDVVFPGVRGVGGLGTLPLTSEFIVVG